MLANSGDYNHMSHSAASDLSLHCLPMIHIKGRWACMG